ncbi:hypothetical protein K458DRAFT_12792 [Lentithecium fluviatile CBS 122367]|uniref:Uncharacterized protein n=1 Tax=Lentithecium fluviatile CBS 122367 TaxID=1168545 RepID=A0A6G1JQ51_9PLEO|nr:hypothetical protein K458DRAFT_12792 [Lentithecium fluviatile CBS 122367]
MRKASFCRVYLTAWLLRQNCANRWTLERIRNARQSVTGPRRTRTIRMNDSPRVLGHLARPKLAETSCKTFASEPHRSNVIRDSKLFVRGCQRASFQNRIVTSTLCEMPVSCSERRTIGLPDHEWSKHRTAWRACSCCSRSARRR